MTLSDLHQWAMSLPLLAAAAWVSAKTVMLIRTPPSSSNGHGGSLHTIEALMGVLRDTQKEDRTEMRTIYTGHAAELRAIVGALNALTEQVRQSTARQEAHELATAPARGLVQQTHDMVNDIHREMVPPRLSRP